jgi:hypothetical protein
MFGLPFWVIELIITFLQRIGAFSTAQAVISKSVVVATKHVENLKTYREFPKGRNGA